MSTRCCALGTCVDPNCYLCRTVGQLEQPVDAASRKRRRETNTTRDGVAVKQGRDPVFTKRKRKAL